jgi:ketosteroid isomerase-like protein
MRYLLCASFLLAACAGTDTLERSPVASPAPVIAAEREFAADAAVRGWVAAFRSYASADATMLSPDPTNAQAQLAQIEGDGSTALDWRPAYAGISRSADFGFTTGPFQIRGRDGIVGHYFTVWRRQPDGAWKWIFDAGTDVADPGPIIAADADIPTLEVSRVEPMTPEAAIAEVEALEEFANRAHPMPAQTLGRHLAEDARVNRVGAPAAIGRAPAEALFVNDTGAFTPVQHEAAADGDMVFSFGEVRDQHEGTERLRYYARIWQRRADGWRIVFDEIVPRRG